MHKFSRRFCACSPGKCWNLESLKCQFPGLWGEIVQNSDGQKLHCNISEASQTNVFALQPEPGAPPSGPLGLGPPVFARSEPTVVLPLIFTWWRTWFSCYSPFNNILFLSRCCEGDSLISSLSHDMLSTNKTLEKCDFDYVMLCYHIYIYTRCPPKKYSCLIYNNF